jgi:two-component system phosphate regulon sensor histidine kinase PhoR
VRRPRLFWRIYATYLVIVVLCTAAVGFYAVRSVRDFYYDQTERDLQARGALIRDQLTSAMLADTPQQLEGLVRRLGRASGTRITLIAADRPGAVRGQVLADSEADPATMENHTLRPEFQIALQGRPGQRIGYSQTLKEDMMYVAIPVTENGQITTVLRTALPLTSVNDALTTLYGSIGISALVVAVLAAIIGLYVSRRISGQMNEIKVGAERLAAGDFTHKLLVPRVAEFASVAESINHMAEELDDKLRRLTHERNEREAVLASMVEGVLAVDIDERVIAVNAAAARLLDTDPASAEGKTIQEVVRNTDLQHIVAQTLGGHRPVEADIVMRVGAEERNLQANGTLLHGDDDGGAVGAVVVLNDVTRLKRLEAVRRDFVANVSHELKTPVTSIKGFAETLEDGALDDPVAAHRFVRIISGQADRLNSIIEDLLALSTLEQSGDSPLLQLEEADLCDVVAVALEVCGPKADAKSIELREDCPGRLLARVSPPLLEQAVVNLIDNAVKYSAEGSTVVVTLQERGDEVVVSVVDEGQGIAREHLPRLFERFYRVDKARSRDLGGTGLGLSIVKHVAQIHGGRVSVDSVLGRGSTFRIHLPRG